jgi:hypothetical protein
VGQRSGATGAVSLRRRRLVDICGASTSVPRIAVWPDAPPFAASRSSFSSKTLGLFTDPPYNVPIDGHASGLGAIHHRPFPMASGEMDRTEFTDFLGQAHTPPDVE